MSRMVAFTDGVIAIAITLLVLDIAVPEIPDALVAEELGDAIWELRPQIFGFVVSFSVVAYYWLSHRLVFSHLRTIDLSLMIINLFFLLMIAFNPFATALLAEYVPEGLAVAIYAGVAALIGATLVVMTAYPRNRGHFDPSVPPGQISLVTRKMAVAPIVFVVTIPIAFLAGWVAVALWALIPIGRYAVARSAG
jgi:uncharacterized membrane protein